MRWLTAIPIYNEARHIRHILTQVRRESPEILAVDDGSTDGTCELLSHEQDLRVVHHSRNRGYGAALQTAFDYAIRHRFDALVTIDADGQHDPRLIPKLLGTLKNGADIASGSRYLREFRKDDEAPTDRREINFHITDEINQRYGFELTDAFCGFKAYRRSALEKLQISEPGWGMPLQVWVQAFRLGLKVREVAVPRIYLDPTRTFGGVLNDAEQRLAYYQRVIAAAEQGYLPHSRAVCLCERPHVEANPMGMRLCRCGRLVPSVEVRG